MRNIFKGSLRGYVCEDCLEAVSEVEILIYHPYRNADTTANTASNAKDTFRFVSKEEAKQRAELLVYKAKTDAEGNFQIEVSENHLDASFDIDFVCGTVPPKHPKPKRDEIVQLHITTFSMRLELEKQAKNEKFRWEYAIAYKWWCYIRGHFFDAWVICGHLMNCQTNKPIANAEVTAMDADFLTDDNLGTATTDSNGHFRIDYTSADFKKTFLSPWINIETDPSFLSFQSGPDVYFKAELGGTKLVDETKADARKNVGFCLCVNLCSEIAVTDPGVNFPSAWTGIGSKFSSSYGTSAPDFDAEGYASSDKNVLYSIIKLTGQAALRSVAGNPIEYRFSVSDATLPNDDINNPPLAGFTKIVGLHPNLFFPGVVSKLIRKVYSPIHNQISVVSAQSDFDAEGWFDVNHAIERALVNAGFTPADLILYNIIEEDTLISMNTTALTTAPDVPNIFSAGQPIPPANEIPVEKFAIRFEIREVINKASNQFGFIDGGKILNSVIMNNNPIYRRLAIKELEETTLCTPINGTVHAKYTLYHPYLASGRLHLNSNSLSIDRDVADGIINTTLVKRINDNSALNAPPLDNLTRCTYALKLHSSTRKHNGEDGDSDGSTPLEQIFFYDENQV
ncbi:hypothetical protein SAMN05444671_4628 [Flavobacterium sp. CF108]|uniref:hypothetical protein n=1 Tax=unclassified Flavobacterium TaxID=196869 RepID=UPI0008D23845|nr:MULTISPECIES: hypothetical protein [unclassified Flavobacterium]SEP22730.1 hypothetical protein SAMN04487978_0117 [Flavobacterium sp. fv08]SHI00028.1 hypothetical protein SAMN05444671_4628 [Flavobacterium sp. CF108]